MRRNGADSVADFIHEVAGEKVSEELYAEADDRKQSNDKDGNAEFGLKGDVEKGRIVDDQRLYDVSRITGKNRMLIIQFFSFRKHKYIAERLLYRECLFFFTQYYHYSKRTRKRQRLLTRFSSFFSFQSGIF